MKNIRFFLFLICLLFFSCKKNEINFNSSKQKPHIRKNNNIEFYVNKKANMLTEVVVRETFQNWAKKTHFTFEYKGRNNPGLKRDNKNTISFLISWPNNIPMNKVAWCQNWYDKHGNIIETDIIFNMLITRFTTLKTNTPNSYYIEGVLSHEIGHMIGLGHIESETSIMKSTSSTEESFFKGEIDEETLAAYKKLYGIIEKIRK
ncbi:MAG: matrixin family metalloprotease [Spirochaetes bacterium]|nr:matrixin family metalloprotease [Spirochaetota bacterium]